jgi:arginase family enzyme
LNDVALTVFRGRAGDRNDLAIPGAAAIGAALARRFDLVPTSIGKPAPALGGSWKQELDAALPSLQELAAHYDELFTQGSAPLTAFSRCAVALATLPVVARHRPDAKVIWLDAHADLNTPEATPTGYLGGLVVAGAAGLWDSGLGGDLDLSRVILVGVRDIDPPEQALFDAGRSRMIPPHADLASELRDAIAGHPVYFHLDCDVLNPGIVPTEYHCEGGLTLADLRQVCEVAAESEVIGVEIGEFQNAWTEGGEPVSPIPLLSALQPVLERLFRNS